LHPQEIASIAAQIKLESLPNDLLDRLQAVIDATVLIQQPWDEGRSVRFDCQSLIWPQLQTGNPLQKAKPNNDILTIS